MSQAPSSPMKSLINFVSQPPTSPITGLINLTSGLTLTPSPQKVDLSTSPNISYTYIFNHTPSPTPQPLTEMEHALTCTRGHCCTTVEDHQKLDQEMFCRTVDLVRHNTNLS